MTIWLQRSAVVHKRGRRTRTCQRSDCWNTAFNNSPVDESHACTAVESNHFAFILTATQHAGPLYFGKIACIKRPALISRTLVSSHPPLAHPAIAAVKSNLSTSLKRRQGFSYPSRRFNLCPLLKALVFRQTNFIALVNRQGNGLERSAGTCIASMAHHST
jgi:hypothetical protein